MLFDAYIMYIQKFMVSFSELSTVKILKYPESVSCILCKYVFSVFLKRESRPDFVAVYGK